MNKELKDTKLLQKISDVQNELKVPKGQFNEFGNFWHRSAEDILVALKPILKKHNLLLTMYESAVAVGARVYIESVVTVHCTETGERYSTTALAREAETKKKMDDSQITGSTISYARKYALGGLFALDDTKDSDTMDNSTDTKNGSQSKTPQKTNAPTVKQLNYLDRIADKQYPNPNTGQIGATLDEMANHLINKSVKTADDARLLFDRLKAEGIIDEQQ